MWWRWRFTVRDALAAMALFWVVGVVLLLVGWRGAVAADQVSDAPLCTADQVFTSTGCRFTLDGTMTGLTSDRAEVDVDGRHFSVNITFGGLVPEVAGTAVKVTLFRGRPVHVEGPQLRFDSDDAPGAYGGFFRNVGSFFIVFGTLAGGANLIIALARRAWKQPA